MNSDFFHRRPRRGGLLPAAAATKNGGRRIKPCCISNSGPKQRRAAGSCLLLVIFRGDPSDWDQDLVHRHPEEDAEGVEVVDRGKARALLPLVDRLRLVKAEEALQIADGETALHPQTADIVPGRDEVDHGKRRIIQDNAPFFVVSISKYHFLFNLSSTFFLSPSRKRWGLFFTGDFWYDGKKPEPPTISRRASDEHDL